MQDQIQRGFRYGNDWDRGGNGRFLGRFPEKMQLGDLSRRVGGPFYGGVIGFLGLGGNAVRSGRIRGSGNMELMEEGISDTP